jgi:hypothetical protein
MRILSSLSRSIVPRRSPAIMLGAGASQWGMLIIEISMIIFLTASVCHEYLYAMISCDREKGGHLRSHVECTAISAIALRSL